MPTARRQKYRATPSPGVAREYDRRAVGLPSARSWKHRAAGWTLRATRWNRRATRSEYRATRLAFARRVGVPRGGVARATRSAFRNRVGAPRRAVELPLDGGGPRAKRPRRLRRAELLRDPVEEPRERARIARPPVRPTLKSARPATGPPSAAPTRSGATSPSRRRPVDPQRVAPRSPFRTSRRECAGTPERRTPTPTRARSTPADR